MKKVMMQNQEIMHEWKHYDYRSHATAHLETRHEPLLYENEVTNFYPMVSYKEKNLLKTYKMSNL